MPSASFVCSNRSFVLIQANIETLSPHIMIILYGTSREHQKFQNLQGSGVGYMRARVRVGILYPCKTLTLSRGSGVYTYPQLGVRGIVRATAGLLREAYQGI
jgi:hypothetical protein